MESPVEELEKQLKGLKKFVIHRKNNNSNQPDPLEVPGTKPPTKGNTWRNPWLHMHM
jgi:ribosomal protein S17